MKYKIGSRLREIRLEKGLTAKHVANVVGISPSTLSKYESNDRAVKAEILPKFADALGVDIQIFFEHKTGDTSTLSSA